MIYCLPAECRLPDGGQSQCDSIVKGRSDAVLDTDRPLLEQIDAYNEFGIPYES